MIRYIALIALLLVTCSKASASFNHDDNFAMGADAPHQTEGVTQRLSKLKALAFAPDLDAHEVFPNVSLEFPESLNSSGYSAKDIDFNAPESLTIKVEAAGDEVVDVAKVPEPSSIILLAIGLLCVFKVRRSINANAPK